jgi:hypothetical protein
MNLWNGQCGRCPLQVEHAVMVKRVREGCLTAAFRANGPWENCFVEDGRITGWKEQHVGLQ